MLYSMLPFLVLLLGALIIAGALAVTPNIDAEMQRRISLITASAPGKPMDTAASAVKPRASHGLDARLRRVFAVGASATWGMRTGAVSLLLISANSGIAVSLFVARALELSWWLAIATGALAAFMMPRALLLRAQRRAESQFMDMFPDALETIVRMLRAGVPMTSAVQVVGAEILPPVSTVFNMIADQVKIGVPIEEALDAGSTQIGLADFRFFAVTVLLHHSAGGNIASTLEVLSGIMRKRRAVRMKAKSATAEIRLTGYILASLPFLVIGALLVVQPGYLAPLFADPRGHMILALAGGGLLMSALSMRLLMRSVTKV